MVTALGQSLHFPRAVEIPWIISYSISYRSLGYYSHSKLKYNRTVCTFCMFYGAYVYYTYPRLISLFKDINQETKWHVDCYQEPIKILLWRFESKACISLYIYYIIWSTVSRLKGFQKKDYTRLEDGFRKKFFRLSRIRTTVWCISSFIYLYIPWCYFEY